MIREEAVLDARWKGQSGGPLFFLCLLNKNGYVSLATSVPSLAFINTGRVLGNPYP